MPAVLAVSPDQRTLELPAGPPWYDTMTGSFPTSKASGGLPRGGLMRGAGSSS